MKKYNRIVFLDEENTRLGPLAEALLRGWLVTPEEKELTVSSRGNVVLFPEPVNQKVTELAKSYGLNLAERVAVALVEEDFAPDTLILAMDSASKEQAYASFPKAANIYTLKEFLGSSGDLKLPLGGTIEEYMPTVEILNGLLEMLKQKLFEQDA